MILCWGPLIVSDSKLLIMVLSILSSCAVGQTFKVIDLGLLPGETASASIGMNNRGQIVGCSDDSTDYFPCAGVPGHAVLWDSVNGLQDLGTLPGDTIAGADAINESGKVVGYSENAQGISRAFSWTANSGMIALPALPGGTNSGASAINAGGIIVGYSDFKNSNGSYDAVAWTPDGQVHDLGALPGFPGTQANGINSTGRIAGNASGGTPIVVGLVWTIQNGVKILPSLIPNGASVTFAMNQSGVIAGNADAPSGDRHPVLWTPAGVVHDLGTLSGGSGTAFQLNDLNVVVGYSTLSSGDRHAFVWSKLLGIRDLNDFTPLNSGWVLVWASAINNRGEITGWGTINGEDHAYLLVPNASVPPAAVIDP